jgi:hypothetical protein
VISIKEKRAFSPHFFIIYRLNHYSFCFIDFIIFLALLGVILPRIVITYDIGCQWSKKLRKRMEEFPQEMQIPETTQVDVAIPGWHINGHGEFCRNNFNLSYMEGAGRTVGEDIETTWAGTNPLAPSVREMGPAARHDTLNDHWNGWNFRKIVGFRMSFSYLIYLLFVRRLYILQGIYF